MKIHRDFTEWLNIHHTTSLMLHTATYRGLTNLAIRGSIRRSGRRGIEPTHSKKIHFTPLLIALFTHSFIIASGFSITALHL